MPVYAPGRVKGRTHHGHLWAWGNYETVIFTFTMDKRGETVAQIFEGFAGTLLIDGASDFNLLEKSEGVTRAGCWAPAGSCTRRCPTTAPSRCVGSPQSACCSSPSAS